LVLKKIRIRKFGLRILIEHLQIGVGGRGVQVVIELLAIFAVIALCVGEAKEAFFEDRITPVPEHQGETEPLMVIAESGDSIFAPTVGATARVIVGKIVPGIAVRTIVLADGAPLALAEVGSPFTPETILRFGALLLRNAEEFALIGKVDSVHGRIRFVVYGGLLTIVCDTKTMAWQTST